MCGWPASFVNKRMSSQSLHCNHSIINLLLTAMSGLLVADRTSPWGEGLKGGDTQGRFGDARGTQRKRAREFGDQLISDA